MSNKAATVLLTVVIGMTLLMCLCFAAIFIEPEIPLNPYPPSIATERAELTAQALNPVLVSDQGQATTTEPFFPPTWTPTMTPTPSVTPTPTTTRTPTPSSTPTPTPTPFPTRTATPTPPPPPPPPPTPTNTTAPPLYVPFNIRTEANCDVIRVHGKIFNANGIPLGGVTMQVGEVNIPGSRFNTSPSDANGRYVFDFAAPDDNSHTWFVVPLENGQPAVSQFEFTTDSGKVCEELASVQIVTVDWRKRP